MKITVNQSALAKALSVVRRSVSSRSTLPILSHVRMEATGDTLRLSTTNLSTRVDYTLPATIEAEGKLTAPAALFGDMIGKLSGGTVEIAQGARNGPLAIRCGNYKATLPTMGADSFPERCEVEADGVVFAPLVLRQLIGLTAFAAIGDESRPILQCVEVVLAGKSVSFAATDGYRLSVAKEAVADELARPTLLIPAVSLAELGRIAADAEGDVILHGDGHTAIFVVDCRGDVRIEFSAQLTDARFPDYRAIIPQSHSTRAVVNRVALLRSLQMAQLLLKGELGIVKLALDGEGVTVNANSQESGSSTDVVGAEVTGNGGLEISFDVRFLVDVLSRLECGNVALECTVPTRPMLIKREGDTDNFLHVIMPMHPPR